MDGKSGDGRFSRRGFGGLRGRVGGGLRNRIDGRMGGRIGDGVCVWRGAHTTHSKSSAGSRRFRVGERQLRGQ